MTSFRTRAIALAMGLAPLAAPLAFPALASAQAQPGSPAKSDAELVNLSTGTGRLVTLPGSMADLYIGNDSVADVQIKSPRQIYILGKSMGETSIQAADKKGRVLYSANVVVGQNTGTVDEMLRMAMPEANIVTTPMNNLVLLTGTVASPDDLGEAQRLVTAYVGSGVEVVNRLRTATPMQVTLKVRIAEVARSTIKSFGVNLTGTVSNPGRYGFDFSRGNPTATNGTGFLAHLSGKFLGFDILSSLDLAENDGLATILAEPTLSAMSGETASFTAGGQFPIPVAGDLGNTTVQFKDYGVQLSFTPTVHSDGRIQLRVSPTVSQLSSAGAVSSNGITIPALSTRTVNTTVELGSGQSYMIAGLLQNDNGNDITKTPLLGDLPVIGALFRSTNFRKSQTELVVIVTPYLTRPVSTQLPTPIDGYRAPTDGQLQGQGQLYQVYPNTAANAGTTPVVASNAAALPAPGFSN